MTTQTLEGGLRQFNAWKQHIARTLDDFQPWLEEHDLFTEEVWNTFARCYDKLESDRITIAFVGEFSRGKTELINALFFSDYGRRLLPSDAGRTTMCPTEILWDDKRDEPYLRLLPIDTRLSDKSLAELRNDTERWLELPLDLDNADELESTLRELANTRRVSVEDAARLGLLTDDLPKQARANPKQAVIPKWRHAVISFPHPLLKQGLTVLDTPGLNAIGAEPELTLNLLPSAQAALFILAADTGVTRSDLEMWQNHLQGHHRSRQQGLTVALNKIDTLWDELRPAPDIAKAIEGQCQYAAKILGVPNRQVFPVSAQKGLLAHVRNDRELGQRSGMPALESHLSGHILKAKQQILMEDINGEVVEVIQGLRQLVINRSNSTQHQINELQKLHGQSDSAIQHLLLETQKEQQRYRNNLKAFGACSEVLKKKAQGLAQGLDPKLIEKRTALMRKRMLDAWTTRGLKQAMGELFQELRNSMDKVAKSTQDTRSMVRSIYQRFQQDHGISVIQPKMFSVMPYQVQLEGLRKEAENFRSSPRAMLTEQHALVRRFFDTLVARANGLFADAHRDANAWLSSALQPLAFQIRDHRDNLSRQIQDLKRATQSRDTLQQRLKELESEGVDLQQQATALRHTLQSLTHLPELDGEGAPARPRLVSSQGGG